MTDAFTEDDLSQSAQWESLGPEYFAGRKVAEDFMVKFEADHFKPLVDNFTDQFRDKLWSDVVDFLLSDTESNIHTAIARMVEGTVDALLTGEAWAIRRYPLSDRYEARKIRQAIAEHVGDELARRRIAQLESEVAELKQRIEWDRRS